jgi:MoaA/NifB/PqqE/SkfB family radical SAM enzyme
MKSVDFLHSWGKVLRGKIPLLSLEITRECPLTCPGCYAYGDSHLGSGVKLKDLADLRGDPLVERILGLVEQHDPIHVSLVGGEPLIRHRELSRVLPVLSRRGTFTMVVTSAVIPIPAEWTALPGVTVAVSVDGLPQDHDQRRAPATYDRILKNIEGRKVNIHCTIVRQQMEPSGYLDQFLAFWSERPEVNRIWFSIYTPQRGEAAAEILTREDRLRLAEELPALASRYPKLMLPKGMERAFITPPANPSECVFSKMSVNYTADLRTTVEPCIFGGDPDCSQCGCSISAGLHWIGDRRVAGPLTVRHLTRASMATGRLVNRLIPHHTRLPRWSSDRAAHPPPQLFQIGLPDEHDRRQGAPDPTDSGDLDDPCSKSTLSSRV